MKRQILDQQLAAEEAGLGEDVARLAEKKRKLSVFEKENDELREELL